MDEGYDYVGSVAPRATGHGVPAQRVRMMNALRERITRIRMTDQGCMLRATATDIVAAINRCHEINTFIPAFGLYLRAASDRDRSGARGARRR